ncbi:methyltransferase [Amaricoccus sp.]|uniref:tRNA1(Val) (adenine(37)-N6)-methyltransferase n=1 Tax=Amaricoccus sp. TaxID=1872485 RepID=UPI002614C9CD|nr:methyltransferase [Amaricoccus sp.]HRO11367.1 methyltransferase [Amaricoccus sp.]
MSFADADLTHDAFLDGRLRLRQPRTGYRAATDPVLLAAFTPARPGERVLDLGCGAGAAALCLARRVPGLDLHGLELQPAYAALARRNAAENALPLEVHAGDLRRMPAALRRLAFDHVIANPPFHPPATTPAPDAGRDLAHREAAPLAAWIDAGLRRLAPGGRLVLIHRAERLGDILAGLSGRAGAVEILPLVPRAGQPARRVLVRARKGIGTPLALRFPLTLHRGSSHAGDGESYTPEAQAVLRGMAALLPEGEGECGWGPAS